MFTPDVTINQDYLLTNEKEKLLDKKSIVATKICEWYESSTTKIIALWSTYNTAKTVLIYKIIEEFKVPRVLFISYRQTLSYNLQGTFKNLNVKSYLDKHYNAHRVICQIDSLPHLVSAQNLFAEELEIPSYDLVIIDEIESVLQHFRASTMSEKEHIFDLLEGISVNCKKIISLDGDFGNRSYVFLKQISPNMLIIRNEVKKNKKRFIFMNNRENFDEKIDKDLKQGKKVAVISMSASVAIGYYNKYKDLYASVMHTSKTDGKLKEKLKNVNDFWINYFLLLISPSIEAGVDFNRDHFDKIYVILSSCSTSQRGLMQMVGRIRKIKCNEVSVLLNGMPFKEKANFYCYDEVKAYMYDTYGKYLSPQVITNPANGKKMVKYKFGLYEEMLVYNEMENFNKQPHYFVAGLINMFNEKGHTYEFENDLVPKKEINKGATMKAELLAADDINLKEYTSYNWKKMNNTITHNEIVKMERYEYRGIFKLNTDQFTAQFLETYYGKIKVIINLRAIFKILNSEKIDDSVLGIIDYDQNREYEKIVMVKQILDKIGFKLPNDGVRIDREPFIKIVANLENSCALFNDRLKSQPLFELSKTRINDINFGSVKSFLGFMNCILANYGLYIESEKDNKSVKIDGKWKTISYMSYSLNYVDNINNYI